ncbi:hypothetical protein ACSC77_004068 [Escherichia coli]|uniref:hypothetical protein n=1 Tax=Escherichia coli TaxID=562 RepID=UPI0012FDD388|nr:hypothetical protein [Escherichia coli]EER0880423.1 hypothetical protein [Escherichia coli]EJV3517753.1 hypothetical protein [Escherichia coli]MDA6825534.1 hypothetical protein [Escherichia coli]MDO2886136.1 hypothetical protein [Escherichia coli]MVW26322.1 hypothetical protein [Escherichia coli]
MAKHHNHEFVRLTIDGKVLSGASEETQYKEWFEAQNTAGLQLYAGIDGPLFDVTTVNLVASPGTGALLEAFLKRGYHDIKIEIVSRSSDKFSDSYESVKTVYFGCSIHEIMIKADDEDVLLTRISFTPEDKVEITLQVPNKDDGALEKIGPITYDIAAKNLA